MKKIKLSPQTTETLWNGTTNEAVPGHGNEDLGQGQMEELEKNPCTRELNPLKIDLVLETFFSFCPVDTLKNCRLVSKQWKDVSLQAWRNKVILHPGKKSDGLHNVQKYLKLLQSDLPEDAFLQLKSYPFKNFVIKPTSFREYLKDSALPIANVAHHVILRDYKDQLVQIKEFLSKFHSLQNLELENCEWNRLHEGPIPTSNVKKLKIFRNLNQGSFVRASTLHIYEDWEALMKCFQNLETLSIEYRTRKDCMPAIHELLRCICNIRTDSGNTAMPLKELKIIQLPQTSQRSASWFGAIMSSLIECQFPLERLSIHIVQNENDLADHQGIHRLLEAYKDTLQYWETSFIFDLSRQLNARTPFRMDALKEVRLSNGLLGLNVLADIELPSLEKLVISNEESTKRIDEIIKEYPLSFLRGGIYGKLETLEFLDNRKIPGPKTITAFAKMMPNLVNLTIPLDKQTFELVCENFRGLKSLNVLAAQCRYNELDDESLTGIPKGGDPQAPSKPNITDLVHLTNLKIACETELQGNAPFTDHSVVHGILQLPELYSISISFKEISDENKKKLLHHVKGHVDIQVKTEARTESYCDIEIDLTSPEI